MPEVILQPGSLGRFILICLKVWKSILIQVESLEFQPAWRTLHLLYTESSSDGVNVEYQFSMEILDDYDGDGVPNDLPDDYPVNGTLIEDNDDDNDGIPDEYETGTGVYVNGTDLGTDALNLIRMETVCAMVQLRSKCV